MHAIAMEATATICLRSFWLILVAFLLPAKTPIPCAINKIGSNTNTSLFPVAACR